ncbi:MAG: TIGR02996 domain-containing protein [Polyangiaceae bacterium]
MLQPGDIIGSFRVAAPLHPGTARLYVVAAFEHAGTPRVLKLLPPDTRNVSGLAALSSASADSEHVVKVYGVIYFGGHYAAQNQWVVLEYVEGTSLAAYLEHRGTLGRGELVGVLEGVARALESASRIGVAHGHVDPSSVLLAQPANTVKLAGFDRGFAPLSDEPERLLYLAPELTESTAPATSLADVWSAGILAFRALTGAHYHRVPANASGQDVLRAVRFEVLAPPSQRAQELGVSPTVLPDGFDAWFGRCVTRDPSARFTTVTEAVSALAAVLGTDAEPLAHVAPWKPDDDNERALVDAIRATPADGEARAVYADWLEQRGQRRKLAVLRGEVSGGDGAGPGWRAVVAQSPVSRCVRFAFVCPKRWDSLTPTSDDAVRFCPSCMSNVYFCSTVEEAHRRGAARECIAIDAALARGPLDEAYDGRRGPGGLGGAIAEPDHQPLLMGAPAPEYYELAPEPPPAPTGFFARVRRWFGG